MWKAAVGVSGRVSGGNEQDSVTRCNYTLPLHFDRIRGQVVGVAPVHCDVWWDQGVVRCCPRALDAVGQPRARNAPILGIMAASSSHTVHVTLLPAPHHTAHPLTLYYHTTPQGYLPVNLLVSHGSLNIVPSSPVPTPPPPLTPSPYPRPTCQLTSLYPVAA